MTKFFPSWSLMRCTTLACHPEEFGHRVGGAWTKNHRIRSLKWITYFATDPWGGKEEDVKLYKCPLVFLPFLNRQNWITYTSAFLLLENTSPFLSRKWKYIIYEIIFQKLNWVSWLFKNETNERISKLKKKWVFPTAKLQIAAHVPFF